MMVKIRKGRMRDCADILTVYQTTRWLQKKYMTVEEVKEEHRGLFFRRWGWLVAEIDEKVVGETTVRLERNPVSGRIGIVRTMDVDVRHQKKGVGTSLARAAETILRKRKAVRVVADSPPEAYNFWMKIGYFARGSLLDISIKRENLPEPPSKDFDIGDIEEVERLPASLKYSHMAHPGLLAELARDVLVFGEKGRVLEFRLDGKPAGTGVVKVDDQKRACFVADINRRGKQHLGEAIVRTARASHRWRATDVCTTIPKERLTYYEEAAPWNVNPCRTIPVTRLL
jgi:GNAT superfamily N-acetyltransferase